MQAKSNTAVSSSRFHEAAVRFFLFSHKVAGLLLVWPAGGAKTGLVLTGRPIDITRPQSAAVSVTRNRCFALVPLKFAPSALRLCPAFELWTAAIRLRTQFCASVRRHSGCVQWTSQVVQWSRDAAGIVPKLLIKDAARAVTIPAYVRTTINT